MEIDYENLINLSEKRKMVIEDASLEDEKLNVEYMNLNSIIRSARKILMGKLDNVADTPLPTSVIEKNLEEEQVWC